MTFPFKVIFPKPTGEQKDTGLRYTDILFGFVIREIFIRMAQWPNLTSTVRWHMGVGATLVLGSWIGYRRSLNRSSYDVKFFNLPFMKFLLDQWMLILYFRVAVLTPADAASAPTSDAAMLVVATVRNVLYVFLLYLAWDILGLWMATANLHGFEGQRGRRYPLVSPDWRGFVITLSALVLVLALNCGATRWRSNLVLAAAIAVLVGYRFAKEIRTSLQPSPA